MNNDNKKLLDLALQAYANGELTKEDRKAFSRDHRRFKNDELTFRELLESIRKPSGALKDAMKSHYAGSIYQRSFK
jgi:hypothetical protein